jgi:gamma-glutamyltranspeptidase/glutathione hydrolase
VVCSTDHLASGAGLTMLRAGGSAADAAVAAAAVLAVTQPYQCGPGGDLFALVHDGGAAPHALNSSGRAGSGADPQQLRAEGHTRMPFRRDARTVTVPGCVDGWVELHRRFGRLSLAEVLTPAVDLAQRGFPAGAFLAMLAPMVVDVPGAEHVAAAAGVPAGTLVRRPDLASTLVAIGEGGRDAFYGGAFGDALVALDAGHHPADLAQPLAEWVQAISVDAWDHRIWTVPPPSQGYLTLAGSWIAAGLDLPGDWRDPLWAHLTVEAARWAAYDRVAVLHEGADGHALIAPERLGERRAAVDRARTWALPSPAAAGDTVFLAAVDEDRLAISLIQSNASAFGSQLVAGSTGVFLHNRGLGFNLEPGHPAELCAGRQPPSTLAPALVTDLDGSLRMVLGTMGGDSQPQILLQLLARTLGLGHDPGRALRAPRWALTTGSEQGFDVWEQPATALVGVEGNAPPAWAEGLAARGHQVQLRGPWDPGCGLAHAINISADGSVVGGASDPRAPEAAALAW